MSAQDELPPRWKWQVGVPPVTAFAVTREELATMRAAVERCAELERHEETWKAELDITAAWQERATKAEAELAKVTVERDEARRMAEIRLRRAAKVTVERDEARRMAEIRLAQAREILRATTEGV